MEQMPFMSTKNGVKALLKEVQNTDTHTHRIVLRLFWILSRTIWVSQYQKGKTSKVKPIWIYWRKR